VNGLEHNHLSARCQPSTGDVLLWPAYVPHAIDSGRKLNCADDYERVAISLNISHQPKGYVNEGDHFLNSSSET
jgi:hypothetical protein